MKREELLKSPEYWMVQIQSDLWQLVETYRAENKLEKNQLADKLGVSKNCINQIYNAEFNGNISEFVKISLALGKTPLVEAMDNNIYEKIMNYGK